MPDDTYIPALPQLISHDQLWESYTRAKRQLSQQSEEQMMKLFKCLKIYDGHREVLEVERHPQTGSARRMSRMATEGSAIYEEIASTTSRLLTPAVREDRVPEESETLLRTLMYRVNSGRPDIERLTSFIAAIPEQQMTHVPKLPQPPTLIDSERWLLLNKPSWWSGIQPVEVKEAGRCLNALKDAVFEYGLHHTEYLDRWGDLFFATHGARPRLQTMLDEINQSTAQSLDKALRAFHDVAGCLPKLRESRPKEAEVLAQMISTQTHLLPDATAFVEQQRRYASRQTPDLPAYQESAQHDWAAVELVRDSSQSPSPPSSPSSGRESVDIATQAQGMFGPPGVVGLGAPIGRSRSASPGRGRRS